ncbi:MAG: protein kinase [Phycisphaerae bacterium]|nr:protein kinase [Phycisphaerae bacterium]
MDRLVARALDNSDAGEPVAPMTPLNMVLEQPGSQIDRYKLLEVLGEGGMGVVYLAEQTELVQRRVALKIIKPGMDSQRVLARFEVEKQALALMEHPHIARVYDAGLAPSGRPYFVMEHIKGLPITKHCDEHRLTIEQRLRLFLHVCGAVQHAHQKGIIHRDLKPSNILVVIQDQEMIPKVIDFGIARAINQPLTERTLYTDLGQPIGTPEYMSPEQASPANQDIDTRTDVYSLGVVLYELLAGILPFDPETFRTGGIEHIRQVICEENPKTPSTRLSKTSVEESTKAARRRQTDVRTLRRRLRGDLDWITLKALEKDRARRYATVDALATDIRNYLNHEPVSAASPRALYRAGKFARRHRQALAVLAATVALFLVLLWAVQAHVQAGRERTHVQALEHERILAEARKLFERRGIQAQGTADSSSDALAMIKPLLTSPHVGPKARLLFANILAEYRYYEEAVPRLEKLLDERPEIAGAAHTLLARIIWESSSLGPADLKHIEEHRQKAEELLPETAEAYYLRAMTAVTVGEQLAALDKALQINPDDYASLRMRAFTYYASRKYQKMEHDAFAMTILGGRDPLGYSLRATALRELADYEDAIKGYDQALTLTLRDDPQYVELHAGLCETLMRMRRYERVLATAQDCMSQAGGKDLSSLQHHMFCALTALGRYEEASALYQRIGKSGRVAVIRLRDWSKKYVPDTLEAGDSWHPADSKPEGAAFLAMLEAQETYRRLSAKAHRLITGGSCPRWSPDGTQVAFALSTHPHKGGVAVYDLATKQTDLLIVPGQDPSWSPDGRYIAFVRDPQVLRLSELMTGEERPHIPLVQEVWVMKADGTQPRRLAWGAAWPSWSRDAKHVYYQSRVDGMLYVASIEDPETPPTPIFACLSYLPAVSPDGNRVAYIEDETATAVVTGVLCIADRTTGSRIVEWATPLAMWGGEWSPDGGEFSLGGLTNSDVRTGLWIYDVAKRQAAKVLSGPITGASWSRDKSRLLLRVGPLPVPEEIWVADLKPGLSTAEALGPAQTLEEHCLECIDTCNRELEVDPNLYIDHWVRTMSALWIGHDQALAYLQEWGRALEGLIGPSACWVHAQRILANATLRDRLGPLALLLADKAARQPDYARDLAHVLHDLGQQEGAVRLWQRAPATALRGSCLRDNASDTYTVVGSGADIWGTIDDFRFVYKKLTGDGSITARIDSIENVDEWTKAGVMVRRALELDSSNAMLFVTPSGRSSFQYRRTDDGISYAAYTLPNTNQLPHWLRLIRQGNRFTALHSSNGVTWEDVLFGSDQQITIEIPMEETVYMGLAVTSHDITRTAEAHISHVTTTGNVSLSGPFAESQDIRFQLPSLPHAATGNTAGFRP